jgi:formate-dependent nitrite reductase cytochrome c552 subunit
MRKYRDWENGTIIFRFAREYNTTRTHFYIESKHKETKRSKYRGIPKIAQEQREFSYRTKKKHTTSTKTSGLSEKDLF